MKIRTIALIMTIMVSTYAVSICNGNTPWDPRPPKNQGGIFDADEEDDEKDESEE